MNEWFNLDVVLRQHANGWKIVEKFFFCLESIVFLYSSLQLLRYNKIT